MAASSSVPIAPLREAIAAHVNAKRGTSYTVGNATIRPGKPVITKFLQTVMNPSDEVLFPNPGFPIYESQLDYLGGVDWRFTTSDARIKLRHLYPAL